MKPIPALVAALAVTAGFGMAPAAAEGQAFGGYAPLNLEDLRFREIAPDMSAYVLWGNPAVGPAAIMLRLAPRAAGTLRAYASDVHAVVVAGRLRHRVDGTDPAAADLLEAGAYWFQPAGEPHQNANPDHEPVTLFLYVDGPFDPLVTGR